MIRFHHKSKHICSHKWALLDAGISWLADGCRSYAEARGFSLRKSRAWWIFDAVHTSGTVLIFIAPVVWRQLTELYDRNTREPENVSPTLPSGKKRVNSFELDYIGCAFNKAFFSCATFTSWDRNTFFFCYFSFQNEKSRWSEKIPF